MDTLYLHVEQWYIVVLNSGTEVLLIVFRLGTFELMTYNLRHTKQCASFGAEGSRKSRYCLYTCILYTDNILPSNFAYDMHTFFLGDQSCADGRSF